MFRRAIWPMNFYGKGGGGNEIPSVIEDFFSKE